MSRKAFYKLKNNFEVEFLKSLTHEEINKIINKFNDKVNHLQSENERLKKALNGAINYAENCIHSEYDGTSMVNFLLEELEPFRKSLHDSKQE